jgi:hypothetical protein
MVFFLKSNVMIQLHKLAVIWRKRQFFANFFGETICKITTLAQNTEFEILYLREIYHARVQNLIPK